jgi:hypothetical protein
MPAAHVPFAHPCPTQLAALLQTAGPPHGLVQLAAFLQTAGPCSLVISYAGGSAVASLEGRWCTWQEPLFWGGLSGEPPIDVLSCESLCGVSHLFSARAPSTASQPFLCRLSHVPDTHTHSPCTHTHTHQSTHTHAHTHTHTLTRW